MNARFDWEESIYLNFRITENKNQSEYPSGFYALELQSEENHQEEAQGGDGNSLITIMLTCQYGVPVE